MDGGQMAPTINSCRRPRERRPALHSIHRPLEWFPLQVRRSATITGQLLSAAPVCDIVAAASANWPITIQWPDPGPTIDHPTIRPAQGDDVRCRLSGKYFDSSLKPERLNGRRRLIRPPVCEPQMSS